MKIKEAIQKKLKQSGLEVDIAKMINGIVGGQKKILCLFFCKEFFVFERSFFIERNQNL